MKVKVVCIENSSVVKIYIIRSKLGPVAKNATPRPSAWGSNPRPLDSVLTVWNRTFGYMFFVVFYYSPTKYKTLKK